MEEEVAVMVEVKVEEEVEEEVCILEGLKSRNEMMTFWTKIEILWSLHNCCCCCCC